MTLKVGVGPQTDIAKSAGATIVGNDATPLVLASAPAPVINVILSSD